MYETGTVVRVLYVTRAPDNTVLLVVQGLKRFLITDWIPGKDFLRAKIKLIPEIIESDVEIKALHRSLRDLTQEIFALTFSGPDKAIEKLTRIDDPLHLAYIAAAYIEIDFETRQALLEEDSLKAKFRKLLKLLSREKEILSLGNKIKSEVRDEMSKSQRDYYLRQKLKAIKKELGESDETQSVPDNYQQRVDESDMSDEARKEAVRELERLEEMSPQSAEYAMVKTYLDWLLDLPWGRSSEEQTDIGIARIDVPGISTGLAVTSVGGDILFIEATRMEGNGKLTVTGQLGDVMKESARIAHSWVRSKSKNLEIEPQAFKESDVHLHVPAGAIPKDGPSAGIAMVLAQASLYSNRVVRSNVAMTGEVTLRGRVLPVGGIKMKILAAHRAGLKTVILPKRNERDLEDVPDEVRNTMDFVLVERIDDAIEAALLPTKDSSDVAHSHPEQMMSRPQIESVPVTASAVTQEHPR